MVCGAPGALQMTPFFSIITPTLQRDSLLRCCESINSQTFADNWQHIVMVDSYTIERDLIERISHPQRIVAGCATSHKNFGNTCRHRAWLFATGQWCLYLDDDNYLADARILEDLAVALEGIPERWALFPILRHGSPFFHEPPRLCFV